MPKRHPNLTFLLTLTLLLVVPARGSAATAGTDERYFAETGHSVVGKFLHYWDAHGGLAQFGYPISDEFTEVSDLDGKQLGVQYFERAEFEHHPENQPPYDVLLAQLGTMRYKQKYPNGAAGQQASASNPYTFVETGKTIGGQFRVYWEQHGGLSQFGYPISNEFQEVSDLNGKPYTVQYFERAVFELHPENQPPYDVLLAQLGTFRYQVKRLTTANFQHLPLAYHEGYNQFGVKASDSYIVWLEQQNIGQRANTILSYNIRTAQITTVTTMARDYVAIDGSTAVWEEVTNDNCNGCMAAIKGANLDTGQTFVVANCASRGCLSPAIAGNTVVWRGFENTTDKLFSKDLDSGTVTEIASMVVGGNHYLDRPLISDSYIVWAEYFDKKHQGNDYKIVAYERETGVVTTITSFSTPDYGMVYYSLDGQHLLWSQVFGLYYRDLKAGEATQFYSDWVDTPALKGDVAVWSSSGKSLGCVPGQCRVWGLKLSEGKAVQLTNEPGNQRQPIVNDDLLMWVQGDSGGGNGRVVAASLSQTFAAATGK